MKKLRFETTLKCEGCVETLSQHMNKLDFVKNWKVDLASNKKILTVEGEELNKQDVIKSVESAGFTAKKRRDF